MNRNVDFKIYIVTTNAHYQILFESILLVLSDVYSKLDRRYLLSNLVSLAKCIWNLHCNVIVNNKADKKDQIK